ncbi:hypothetical protein SAMN05444161_9423 [Rhizobiales bacterium GAS191]|nr:hypothetical protein SAMN05519103_09366 [Rhizobiales bacterium GAS113]SEF03509.1 hypothetical protein SAMN05519104_7978 [Rhizobiales bacterium GAS188]SEF15788.1 hypothetical protein SAMN05444161_9423 [Rhizobiales bacterium GAS191]
MMVVLTLDLACLAVFLELCYRAPAIEWMD